MVPSTTMWYTLLFVLVSVSGLEVDKVLLKPNGNRYQYMVDGNGTSHLVDLRVNVSDIRKGFFYDPDKDNVYLLLTRVNPTIPIRLKLNDDAMLRVSTYDARRHTAVLIHGWRSDRTAPFYTQLVPAFLAAQDMNVIVVDWSQGSGSMNYLGAVLNTIDSGVSVGRFIAWLNRMTGGSLSSFHVVGHSLGAHQACVVSRQLNKEVPYLTALDPALPLWDWDTFKQFRCGPLDALYTEVIHSDGRKYGMMAPLGQVDFYPNGGLFMQGCNDDACSHNRAIYYFAESLASSIFWGYQCLSVTYAKSGYCWGTPLYMGGIHPKNYKLSGIYHVKTNEHAPYSNWSQTTHYNLHPTRMFGDKKYFVK